MPSESTQSAIDILARNNTGLVRKTLDNGMVCLIKEDHSAPVVAIQIWVNTGSANEGRWLGAGLCHAIEHMIFKGTDDMKVGDVSRLINNAGGDINAYTSMDRTVFHTDLPSRNWKTGLSVLAKAMRAPAFPADEWAKEREVILREIAMGEDSPGRVMQKLLFSTSYAVHPYNRPVIGHEELFRKITKDDLAAFYRQNYLPDGMITVVVGDISATEVMKEIESLLGSWSRDFRDSMTLPAEPAQISTRLARKTGAYEVTRISFAYHTVPLSHPDAPALDLLAIVGGQGRSSRLTLSLQEQKKLVTEISAWSFAPLDPGIFGMSAVLTPDKEQAVIDALAGEVETWKKNGFTEEEVEKARRMTMTGVLSELQTMQGQAESLASGQFYAVDPRFSETYLKSIASLTAADLKAVAVKYLKPANLSMTVLAPESATVAPAQSAAYVPPVVERITLSNGLKVLVRPDSRLPFVFLCATINGGLLSEKEDDNGITQLMSELLTRGTKKRTAEEIAQITESLGGSLGSFSGQNSFGLRAHFLSGDADLFMEIAADCLLNPAFTEEQLQKQKLVQAATIRQEKEAPFAQARQELRNLVFPNHPYRFSPAGTLESLNKLNRSMLADKARREIMSGNMVISIFGNLTAAQAKQLAERHFGAIPAGTVAKSRPALPTPVLPARTQKTMPKEQAILLAGFPGIDIYDPRFEAMSILETAMNGLSSELGMEVREKRGLVYFVGAINQVGAQPATFILYAGTRADAVEELEKLYLEEIKRVTTKGLTEEEWDRARSQILADFDMQLQNNGDLAMRCAMDELLGLGYEHVFNLRERIERVTREDLRKAAASILVTNRMAVSLVLPENTKKIKSSEKE